MACILRVSSPVEMVKVELRHGRGNLDMEQCWNLRTSVDHDGRQAEEYCDRESPQYAYGESYRA